MCLYRASPERYDFATVYEQENWIFHLVRIKKYTCFFQQHWTLFIEAWFTKLCSCNMFKNTRRKGIWGLKAPSMQITALVMNFLGWRWCEAELWSIKYEWIDWTHLFLGRFPLTIMHSYCFRNKATSPTDPSVFWLSDGIIYFGSWSPWDIISWTCCYIPSFASCTSG